MFFSAFENYFDFENRATRREYWGFQIINILVWIFVAVFLVSALNFSSATFDEAMYEMTQSASFLFGIVLMVFWIIIGTIPAIAVTVRRFHDRDMSGWWYLGFIGMSCLPFVGWVAGIAMLVITLLPGTPGDNRFGADPRDRGWGGNAFA